LFCPPAAALHTNSVAVTNNYLKKGHNILGRIYILLLLILLLLRVVVLLLLGVVILLLLGVVVAVKMGGLGGECNYF